MTTEIEGQVGPIKGVYKIKGTAPIVIESCKHLIIFKEKTLRKDRLVIVHGKGNGDNKISEYTIGEDK